MRQFARFFPLLVLPMLMSPATPADAQVSPQNIDTHEARQPLPRRPARPRWQPHRPDRPDRPWRPAHPHWPPSPAWPDSDWDGGWGGGWGLSLDLGDGPSGADGSVREPVMTIERDSPAGTRQIRNSPGAPTAPASGTTSRISQPPRVDRATGPVPAVPSQARQGVGELNGGGSAFGQVLSADGNNYVLLLTLPDSRVTCTGQLDGPLELFPTLSSALACTDGAQGNALFATPETGTGGSSASFTLDGGRGGYLMFP